MDQAIFKDMLREKGLKVTNQRLNVLETMAAHPGEHLTTEEIYDLVRVKEPEIGLATVYRTVQVLFELQVIDKVSFDDGFIRYELRGMDQNSRHQHHHAICNICGKVYSFQDDLLDTLEQALYDNMGFAVTNHEVKLYGTCKTCMDKLQKEADGKKKTEESD
ncbi:transcriptional repressor [Clostridium sp. chh4-2]|uniref:Fur family transcriptional regulator n=1 Tax=Clostridium sp. chh4-2 TaxID=2067550 RepID=UPI000CCE4289|nr:Fur family transcriptional regulator [Clostridium sp. chh4-2]PNV63459.1 transcriptional repressor [Clostridium sp. chh4-2]